MYNVGISASDGSSYALLNCEDMGSVTFTGVHNGTVNLRPILEEYCDDPAGSIVGSTPIGAIGLVGGITQLTIIPMNPLVWQYVDPLAVVSRKL